MREVDGLGRETGAPAACEPRAHSLGQRTLIRLPRLEYVGLVLAFAWTVGAKWYVLHSADEPTTFLNWAAALLPDALFFAALLLVFAVLAFWYSGPWLVRLLMLATVSALLWSGANSLWLLATGVQLQPAILGTLSREPLQFWPVVETHLVHRPWSAAIFGVTLLVAAVGLLVRLIWPRPLDSSRTARMSSVLRWGLVTGLALVGLLSCRHKGMACPVSEVLSVSSHWYALTCLVRGTDFGDVSHPGRLVASDDGRAAPAIATRPAVLPNVVIVLLESISHAVTSLGESGAVNTPNLRRLAEEGTEFVYTRVPVAHTTEAIWSVCLGVRPEAGGDSVESVLMDVPYAGLPTFLKRYGYRSAFFEMSKGSFECAPGLAANLGFDWAWFRENLEDPSAHLGYLGGDDLRLLDPALAWATRESSPFLLVVMTSASHDPFLVPSWFGPRKQDREQAYHQSIEYTDYFLGQLGEQLQRRGLGSNTILCVIGDHGESFRAHGRTVRYIPYEELVRVPWVVWWPGHVPAGAKVEAPCSQLDVAPTLAGLIGLDEEQMKCEGLNAFKPIPPDRRIHFNSWYSRSPRGYVVGDLKYVYWPYNDKVFRYDLRQDPREEAPVLLEGAEKQEVIAITDAWVRESLMYVPPQRFRERLLFDHWRTFASGRRAWAYYVP